MASIPSNGYAEVMAGTNNYSGSNSFDGSCPQTAIPPVVPNDLCNKLYVDTIVGGGTVVSVTGGNNITVTPTTVAPVVNLKSPLTSTLALGTQNITGSTSVITLTDNAAVIEMGGNGIIPTLYGHQGINRQDPGALIIENSVPGVSGGGGIQLNCVSGTVSTQGAFQPQRILDTAGGSGTAGQVLSSLGSATGTSWITAGASGVTSITAGLNIGVDSTISSAPVVRVLDPLTSVLNLGTQNVTGTTGNINFVNIGASSEANISASTGFSSYDALIPSTVSNLTKAGLSLQNNSDRTEYAPTTITKNFGTSALQLTCASNAPITLTPFAGQDCNVVLSGLGALDVKQSTAGGSLNPLVRLENTNLTGSVSMEIYKNKPAAGAAGDVLFNQSVYGTDNGAAKQEFTRTTHTIRDAVGGGEDGSMEFSVFSGGSVNTFLQLNGIEGEVNCLKQLDMTGNSIVTNTGNLTISTAASSGNGVIALVSKTAATGAITLTANGGGSIALTANAGTLTTTAINSTFNSTGVSTFNGQEYHNSKMNTTYDEQVYQSTYQPLLTTTLNTFPVAQFQREGQQVMLINSVGAGSNEMSTDTTSAFTISAMRKIGSLYYAGGWDVAANILQLRRSATIAGLQTAPTAGNFIEFPSAGGNITCIYDNQTLIPGFLAIGGSFQASTAQSYNGGANLFPSNVGNFLVINDGTFAPVDMLDSLGNYGVVNGQVTAINAIEGNPVFTPATNNCFVVVGEFVNFLGTGASCKRICIFCPPPGTIAPASNRWFPFYEADNQVWSVFVLGSTIVFGGDFTICGSTTVSFLCHADYSASSSTYPATNQFAGFVCPGPIGVGVEGYPNTSGTSKAWFGVSFVTSPIVPGEIYPIYELDMATVTVNNPILVKGDLIARSWGLLCNTTASPPALNYAFGFNGFFPTATDNFCYHFDTPHYLILNGAADMTNGCFDILTTGNPYFFRSYSLVSAPPHEMYFYDPSAGGACVIETTTALPFVNGLAPTNKWTKITLNSTNAFAMGTIVELVGNDARVLIYAQNNATFSN